MHITSHNRTASFEGIIVGFNGCMVVKNAVAKFTDKWDR
jgi:hypothetical protein